MAVIYLRSTDGNDADDGSTWALAKATLAAALTAAGDGGTVYVSQAHAETQAAAMTLASPGTSTAPVKVLCVSDAAEPPTTLATTATVSTTGASSIIFTSGCTYYYGIAFSAGDGANLAPITFGVVAAGASLYILQNCALILNSTTNNANQLIAMGSVNANTKEQLVKLINTTLRFGHVAQEIRVHSRFEWIDTPSAIAGATIPDILFTCYPTVPAQVLVSGVDLSAMGSGKSLVNFASGGQPIYRFANCKLGASVGIVTGANGGAGGPIVMLDNCDSADTNYRMEHHKYSGSIKSETSKIRSGGASDGTTPISWNMTSSAGASFFCPLESPNITTWNETTSQITITVEIALDSAATALNDDEIWLEVEYLGTSGVPLSLKASDRKADVFTAAAAQTTSTVTWSNMTTPTKQKLAVTFTPAEKGAIVARVMLAKASATAYVDPLITVS